MVLKRDITKKHCSLSYKEIAHAIACLKKVIKNVKNYHTLAIQELGIQPPNIYRWLKGLAAIPPRYVDKLVELSKGECKHSDFRPDIFKN